MQGTAWYVLKLKIWTKAKPKEVEYSTSLPSYRCTTWPANHFCWGRCFWAFRKHADTFIGSFKSRVQRIYNYRVLRGRNVSENGFGILVAWFGILQRDINGSGELGDAIILGTAAIHNWLLQIEEDLQSGERVHCPKTFTDRYRADRSVVRGEWQNDFPELEDACVESLQRAGHEADHTNKTLDGEVVALRFAKYFIDNDVPWQRKRTHVMQWVHIA